MRNGWWFPGHDVADVSDLSPPRLPYLEGEGELLTRPECLILGEPPILDARELLFVLKLAVSAARFVSSRIFACWSRRGRTSSTGSVGRCCCRLLRQHGHRAGRSHELVRLACCLAGFKRDFVCLPPPTFTTSFAVAVGMLWVAWLGLACWLTCFLLGGWSLLVAGTGARLLFWRATGAGEKDALEVENRVVGWTGAEQRIFSLIQELRPESCTSVEVELAGVG